MRAARIGVDEDCLHCGVKFTRQLLDESPFCGMFCRWIFWSQTPESRLSDAVPAEAGRRYDPRLPAPRTRGRHVNGNVSSIGSIRRQPIDSGVADVLAKALFGDPKTEMDLARGRPDLARLLPTGRWPDLEDAVDPTDTKADRRTPQGRARCLPTSWSM